MPKPQFRKKTHGLANARGLGEAEIAGLGLRAREPVARKERTVVTPDAEDKDLQGLESPLGLAGEFQWGTSITLAIHSREQPRQRLLCEAFGCRYSYLPVLAEVFRRPGLLQRPLRLTEAVSQSGRDSILRST